MSKNNVVKIRQFRNKKRKKKILNKMTHVFSTVWIILTLFLIVWCFFSGTLVDVLLVIVSNFVEEFSFTTSPFSALFVFLVGLIMWLLSYRCWKRTECKENVYEQERSYYYE